MSNVVRPPVEPPKKPDAPVREPPKKPDTPVEPPKKPDAPVREPPVVRPPVEPPKKPDTPVEPPKKPDAPVREPPRGSTSTVFVSVTFPHVVVRSIDVLPDAVVSEILRLGFRILLPGKEFIYASTNEKDLDLQVNNLTRILDRYKVKYVISRTERIAPPRERTPPVIGIPGFPPREPPRERTPPPAVKA